jgi:hypothetical protein
LYSSKIFEATVEQKRRTAIDAVENKMFYPSKFAQ